MAVAEACIIKSFRRDYISCNLYYLKLCRLVPAQDKSYKRDFIYKVIWCFHCIIIVLLFSNSICAKLLLSVPGYMKSYMPHIQRIFRKMQTL